MQVDFIQTIKAVADAHNLQLTRVAAPYTELKNFDYGLRQALDPQLEWEEVGKQILSELNPKTMIFAEDVFELQFIMFMLPDDLHTAYILGPWVEQNRIRSQEGITWCRRHMGEESNRVIDQFYNGVRHANSQEMCYSLRALLMLVCGPDLKMQQTKAFRPLVFEPDMRRFEEPLFEKELPATMLERRYGAEAALMDAVEKGDIGSAMAAFGQLAEYHMEPRTPTPLRDSKTIMIVLNVLMRKAIQKGDVHPYYIDKISGRYAVRIEKVKDQADAMSLAKEMVQEYCIYVQKYSLKRYSPLVQKVLNDINLNLNSSLSLKSLANKYYVSPSYLSYLFKQETGQTLTDYINTRRVERAARRLRNTEDTVSDIAESVGVLDVNYFTKIFKKSMGVTPTAYRKKNQK